LAKTKDSDVWKTRKSVGYRNMLGFPYIRFHPQPRITNSNLQIILELPRTRREGDGYRTLPVTLTRRVEYAVSSGGSTVRESRDFRIPYGRAATEPK
jgi:hypothetical protein